MSESALHRSTNIVFAGVLIAFVAALLTAALHPRSPEIAAHLYGRYLAGGREDACPTNFGRAFWFSCAGEVRQATVSPRP